MALPGSSAPDMEDTTNSAALLPVAAACSGAIADCRWKGFQLESCTALQRLCRRQEVCLSVFPDA